MEKTRTPGIYKRGSRYVVVWRHPGKQHKSFHRTYEEAREAKGRRRSGDRRPASREPFEDHARAWLEGFGGRKLRSLFAEAVDDGTLPVDPSARVRVRNRRQANEDEEPARAMTSAEQARVLEAMLPSWLPLFSLLAETGLRISEVLGLEWSDFKLGKRPTLRVRRQFYRGELRTTKTSAGRRELPISAAAARWVRENRPSERSAPVFVTKSGTRLSDRNVRRALDAVTEDLDLGWVTPHVFRHTCASRLLSDGRSIRQVAGWLGHTDPAFTLRTYVHLMDDGLGKPLNSGRWDAE
jgi:integrase